MGLYNVLVNFTLQLELHNICNARVSVISYEYSVHLAIVSLMVQI